MEPSLPRRLGALVVSLILAVGGLVVGASPAEAAVDLYITPGTHFVNGRQWRTACEPYSQTERCRTEIWGTTVTYRAGRFTQTNGWVFNNLTYKASPRSLWRGNPIAGNGEVGGHVYWTAEDGRKWRTECDTPTTGNGGCRSYVEATLIAKAAHGYVQQTGWVLNNMVRFSPVSLSTIKDANLRKCISNALKGTDPAQLQRLECHDMGIKSLEGMQLLTSLKVFGAQNNQLTDLKPLAGLRLNQLAIGGNEVESLQPLAGMKELWHLEAMDNYIDDLSPLKNADLFTLDVTANFVEDLTPLAGKTNLYALRLGDNYVHDLTPLKGLKGLQGVSLEENIIEDVTPLAGLTGLDMLSLGDNYINDVRPLAGLTKLTSLELHSNELGDVAPLKSLVKLRHLTLANNPALTNLDALAPLRAAGCVSDVWP